MTDTERERQRIVATVEWVINKELTRPLSCLQVDQIEANQWRIVAIMEATDE